MNTQKALAFAAALATTVCCVTQAGALAATMRRATVRTGIEMPELANYWVADQGTVPCGVRGAIADFSPNGREFVVVVRRGDLKRNVNQYTMLLWKTDRLRSEKPRTLLRMRSSSVWPAIDAGSISWAADGKSLMFVGRHLGRRSQVFRLNVKTGALRVMTNSPTTIVNFSHDATGTAMAYEAVKPVESLWNAGTARRGLAVTSQTLWEVISGRVDPWYWGGRSLAVENSRGTRRISPLPGSAFVGAGGYGGRQNISMSPNGKYVVVLEALSEGAVPHDWRRYDDWAVHAALYADKSLPVDTYTDFSRYVLVKVKSGVSRVLLNSPVLSILARRVVWAPDSRSVVLSHVLLPIGMRGAKKGRYTTVEVEVPTDRVRTVGRDCAVALRWQGDKLTCADFPDGLELANGSDRVQPAGGVKKIGMAGKRVCPAPGRSSFVKTDGTWHGTGPTERPDVNVFVKEGMNFPPELYYEKRGEKGGRVLWNLDPQLNDVRLAKERLFTWNWSKGHAISGGLYYPIDYRPGRRYPLVIQTHGFRANTFAYFGPYPTAFAAQPLAARNIFVLQVPDAYVGVGLSGGSRGHRKEHAQREAVENAVKVYQSAIARLDREGLIDPKKVGIIGFSATCFYVDWALTHDPGLFAAASVTEGGDGSAMEYMLNLVTSVSYRSLYSGPPFGRYLKSWDKLSPIFNLNRVRAPLLIGVSHHRLALGEWEWLDGLRDLKKPVYMVVLDGRAHDLHMLQKPWDRLISSGDNAEWFDFWLNGREDRRPGTATQYARWEKLRALYRRNTGKRGLSWRSPG